MKERIKQYRLGFITYQVKGRCVLWSYFLSLLFSTYLDFCVFFFPINFPNPELLISESLISLYHLYCSLVPHSQYSRSLPPKGTWLLMTLDNTFYQVLSLHVKSCSIPILEYSDFPCLLPYFSQMTNTKFLRFFLKVLSCNPFAMVFKPYVARSGKTIFSQKRTLLD